MIRPRPGSLIACAVLQLRAGVPPDHAQLQQTVQALRQLELLLVGVQATRSSRDQPVRLELLLMGEPQQLDRAVEWASQQLLEELQRVRRS